MVMYATERVGMMPKGVQKLLGQKCGTPAASFLDDLGKTQDRADGLGYAFPKRPKRGL